MRVVVRVCVSGGVEWEGLRAGHKWLAGRAPLPSDLKVHLQHAAGGRAGGSASLALGVGATAAAKHDGREANVMA